MHRTLVAAALAALMTTAAQADVRWYVTGTFSDGGTVNGWFDINSSGFLGDASLATTAGSTMGSYLFFSPGQPKNNGALFVEFYNMAPNAYQDGIVLQFASDLTVGVALNPLLPAPSSYECRGNIAI